MLKRITFSSAATRIALPRDVNRLDKHWSRSSNRSTVIRIARFILLIQILEPALRISGGKRQRGLFGLGCGTMKKRKRAIVIFLGEQNFRHAIGRGSRKFAIAILVDNSLKT